MDGSDELWLSGLREFLFNTLQASGVSNSYALVPPRVLSHIDNRSPPCVPLDLTVHILFVSLGFRSFKLLCTRSSWSAFTRRIRPVDTYPHGDQRPRSTSGLQRFRSLLDHKFPKFSCFGVVDLAPLFHLDNE
jgi:hypothetical protein